MFCSLLQLLATGALPVRERLRLLLTASQILKGQGEALNIERKAFYTQTYQTLLLVPWQLLYEDAAAAGGGKGGGGGGVGREEEAAADEESWLAMLAARADAFGDQQQQQGEVGARGSNVSSNSRAVGGRRASKGAAAAGGGVGSEPISVLLCQCLELQLLLVKAADLSRAAAFCKRLYSLLLMVGVPEAMGSAALLLRLLRKYPKLNSLFEWEGVAPVGGRSYDPWCKDPSDAGALAAAFWELPLLLRHYHPAVAGAAKALMSMGPSNRQQQQQQQEGSGGGGGAGGGGSNLGVLGGPEGPAELAGVYSSVLRGGFRPAPVAPPGRRQVGKAVAAAAAGRAAAGAPLIEEQLQWELEGEGGGVGGRKRKGQGHGVVVGSEGCEEVEAACSCYHRVQKRYKVNWELRREAAVLARKVQMFQEHLQSKPASNLESSRNGRGGGRQRRHVTVGL